MYKHNPYHYVELSPIMTGSGFHPLDAEKNGRSCACFEDAKSCQPLGIRPSRDGAMWVLDTPRKFESNVAYDECMMNVWWMYDEYMMNIWWMYDECMMGIWWMYDEYDGYMIYIYIIFSYWSMVFFIGFGDKRSC